MLTNGYAYDYAGRLASEISADLSATDYEYDARGNVKAVRIGQDETIYTHSGDILTSVTGPDGPIKNFTHDALGRMTYDGTADQSMTYNILDLVGKVSKGGAALANYSYLADGTKISALDGGGEGLVYRGPFVYRRSTGGGASSLTLESAAFGGGRLTPSGAMLYVTDYLGSVRAVVNGGTGAIYKASDFSAFGTESNAASVQTSPIPAGISFRDAYTGQEDQNTDFSTNYTDFGARQYSPALRRWMTPDPLSENYYGTSPYAFCANNPVNFVDADGESWGKVVKVANKIRKTIKAGSKVKLKGILKSEVLDIADNASTLADSDASLFEKSVATIDLATGFGDQIKWLAKTCGVPNAVINGVQVIDGIKFKSFTRKNFRENLGRLTGGIPDGVQAHHTLPYAFENKFSDIGINIHDPKYGVWLDSTLHNKLSHKYNEAWGMFFEANSTYTEEQVLEYARKLMDEIYGQK